jgi:hypothetical protein
LQEILQEYELKNIWNYDKFFFFGIYYHIIITEYSSIISKKHFKKQVSILVACNTSGNKKLPLFFIYKYKISYILKKNFSYLVLLKFKNMDIKKYF